MTPAGGDWLTPRPRPLPRPVTPAADETLTSYLGRLARANRLDAEALRVHLTRDKRKSASVPVETLAVLSGQPRRALAYAILELCSRDELATMRLNGRPRPGNGGRAPCLNCTLARGHRGGGVWCWNLHDGVVCHKHRRWIGDGTDHPLPGQPDLSRQPEILQANLRHRRLIRWHGRTVATTAYREARYICDRWHQRGEHDQDFERLMSVFHPGHWRLSPSDPTIHAARYPQIIALAALLASPFWQAAAEQQWPEPTMFTDEVRRTVAPRFRWTLNRPYGAFNPLVELVVEWRLRNSDPRTPTDRIHPPPPTHPC